MGQLFGDIGGRLIFAFAFGFIGLLIGLATDFSSALEFGCISFFAGAWLAMQG